LLGDKTIRSNSGKVRWQGDNAEPVWHKVDGSRGTGLVVAVTVDGLVGRFGLTQVDWIKLDVEGAEVLSIEVHTTLHLLEAVLPQFGYSIDKTMFGRIAENHRHVLAAAK